MKEELDSLLVNKYPKIFRDRNADMRTTAMCWGFDHGNGWFTLLDKLCSHIQWHIDQSKGKVPQVIATQVKEKYGGLRFYFYGGDDYIDGSVSLAESLSYKICEDCGSTKNVTQTEGWILTLCEECLKEYDKKRGLT